MADSDESNSSFDDLDAMQEHNDDGEKELKQKFEVLTTDEVVELMNEHIQYVSDVVEIPPTTIRILLSHYKWDRQELVDQLTSQDMDEVFQKAKVLNPFTVTGGVGPSAKRGSECGICFVEYSADDLVEIGCGHTYCKDCWQMYLKTKIVDEGNSESIACPTPACPIIVDDEKIMNLVNNDTTRTKYKQLMTNGFVLHEKSLRWCPRPGCTNAIRTYLTFTYRWECVCSCGYSFCFNCGEKEHDAISCDLMSIWAREGNDKSIKYITQRTKPCPRCFALIEKDGGCERVICAKCKLAFCWKCNGKLSNKVYFHGDGNCAKKRKSLKPNEELHYAYGRYVRFQDMVEGEQELRQMLPERIEGLQSFDKSWRESSKLYENAVDALVKGQRYLMLSCIFSYHYDSQNHQKTIFEDNRKDLEKAVKKLKLKFELVADAENVSHVIESILELTNYCQTRLNILRNHIFEGYEQEWWIYRSATFTE